MSDLKRCPACRGLKYRLGMGGQTVTCTQCNGIGYIESVDDISKQLADAEVISVTSVADVKQEIKDTDKQVKKRLQHQNKLAPYMQIKLLNKLIKADLKQMNSEVKKKAYRARIERQQASKQQATNDNHVEL